jgi:hypothetical protein
LEKRQAYEGGAVVSTADFHDTGKEIELDKKRRVTLGSAVSQLGPGVRYHVFTNELGQVLLDPVKSVPAYEAWVYENPARIASIGRGIAQAESGQLLSIDLDADEDK